MTIASAIPGLAPPVPTDVQAALLEVHVTFTPLTDAQEVQVRVTADEAARTALALPDYESHDVVWTKVGCEFLGMYSDQPLHNETPMPRPAYLVQTFGDPVPAYPSANIAVTIIDATTGGRITGYGAPERPYGLLGTTCGVKP